MPQGIMEYDVPESLLKFVLINFFLYLKNKKMRLLNKSAQIKSKALDTYR